MDAAFKTAAFPGMTTKEIETAIEKSNDVDMIIKFTAEIERREKAANGDESVMTHGERLRFIRTGKAR